MYCPKCRKEIEPLNGKCPVCNSDLDRINEEILEYVEFESVFKTDNQAVIAIVKSLLDDAGIPYALKSQGLQAIYGLGVVQFQVPPESTASAREMLKELAESGEGEIM